jgi:hypothetical protein
VSLRLISDQPFRQVKEWAETGDREVDWDWKAFYRLFKYRHPKRLELALWSGGELDCLAIGRPTYHGHGVRLDFLEAVIRSNDYKAFPIVLLAMEVFAAALGASELRLAHPINETMKIHYQKLGFTYVTKGDYLYRSIAHDR